MSNLFLTQSDLKLGIQAGRIIVTNLGDGFSESIPIEKVDSISVFGSPQISTQLIHKCLDCGIPVFYFSSDGHYFGALSSSTRIDPSRHKKQITATEDSRFSLEIAKCIVSAKIVNSIMLLRSYRDRYEFSPEQTKALVHSLRSLPSASTVSELIGFEGNAAKCYFQCLACLVGDGKFAFCGRSSRPPRDAFNSMLSFGYSLLYHTIIGAIERHGLHPYFAFVHQLKNGHAALASDLIEDSRARVVDKTILDLVLRCEVEESGFYENGAGALYMTNGTMRTVSNAISAAILENRKFFSSSADRRKYSFQSALDKKIVTLINAIDAGNPGLYQPFIWELNADGAASRGDASNV